MKTTAAGCILAAPLKEGEKMKIYKMSGKVEKWIHQNNGELLEVVEGCLLDNYLIKTRRGYAAILEKYVNCWTSENVLYFSTDTEAENLFYSRFSA